MPYFHDRLYTASLALGLSISTLVNNDSVPREDPCAFRESLRRRGFTTVQLCIVQPPTQRGMARYLFFFFPFSSASTWPAEQHRHTHCAVTICKARKISSFLGRSIVSAVDPAQLLTKTHKHYELFHASEKRKRVQCPDSVSLYSLKDNLNLMY